MYSNRNKNCINKIKNKYLKLKEYKLKKNYVTIPKNQYLKLLKYELKHELKVIINNEYDREFVLRGQHNQDVEGHFKEVKELILSGIKHKIIDSDIYDLLLGEHYLFSTVLADDDLKDICIAAIKNAPYAFSSYQIEDTAVASSLKKGIIDNIFTDTPNLIPSLLEVISYSSKDNISILKIYVSNVEEGLKNNLEKAIKDYCTINTNGDYDIEPYYLLPMKDYSNFKEFKQYFKDIYSAINSNDLDKVKDSLEQLKVNIFNYNVDTNNVIEALCCLAKEAKFNQDIGCIICELAGSITYPTGLENANTPLEIRSNSQFI